MARKRGFALTSLDLPPHLQSAEKQLLRLKISAPVLRLREIVAAAHQISRAELIEIAVARLCGNVDVYTREPGDLSARLPPRPGKGVVGNNRPQVLEDLSGVEEDNSEKAA